MDWSVGEYERVACGLMPAATAVVDRAAPAPGERLLDIGCGTGNAALLAAGRGADVTGVDPAIRLLAAARAAAGTRGITAEFLRGEAGALPIAEATFDVVVSVFGVVYAPDAAAAIAEMVRVTRARGRIVFSAWVPTGALFELMRIRARATSVAQSAPVDPPPFSWHDETALARAFGRHGLAVELSQHDLTFSAASPQAFIDAELAHHPAWITARRTLTAGRLDQLREDALALLVRANERRDGFEVTSRYVTVAARRFQVP
jgi:SAM-dependent methyltransferase